MKFSLFLVFSCLALFSMAQQQENTPKKNTVSVDPANKIKKEQISNSKKIEKRVIRPATTPVQKKEEEISPKNQ